MELPSDFDDQLITGGLNYPAAMAFLPDGRLVVAETGGVLRFVVEGKLGAVDPFGVVDSVRTGPAGRGLLGVAVDSRWPASPYVYVSYETLDSTLRVSRYTAEGDLDSPTGVVLGLDPVSRHDLLRDLPDHGAGNGGGTLRFGPGGFLFLSLGDDGDSCAAQDSSALRGVVLRLDVSGVPDGPGDAPPRESLAPADNPFASSPDPSARLVWALGLRHPFRFHVDALDGALFIADIGDQSAEEVDRADSGGMNFGWPFLEGDVAREAACPDTATAVPADPIHVYHDRSAGNQAAIIGAGIYRTQGCTSCTFPAAYEGSYFFADYYSGFLRRLQQIGGVWQLADSVAGQPSLSDWGRGFEGVSDYGFGPDGALWYCRNGQAAGDGEIHRIVKDGQATAVHDAPGHGIRFAPPSPSPSRGGTRLTYETPRAARVTLEVFDTGGRRQRVLVDAVEGPGTHEAHWDGLTGAGGRAPAGVYHARLSVDGVVLARNIVLLR